VTGQRLMFKPGAADSMFRFRSTGVRERPSSTSR